MRFNPFVPHGPEPFNPTPRSGGVPARFNPFVPHGPEPITPTPKSGGLVPSVVEFFKKKIDELFSKDSVSVHYTPEEKTKAEKGVARGNIGAQEKLVSGVNLKTVGGQSLLGSGDVSVPGADGRLPVKPLPKYLHALEFDDTYPEDAEWFYGQLGPSDVGHCSAVRRGGKLWRNYDWTFDDSASFAIKVSGNGSRFASVGMASVGSRLTENDVMSGVYSRYYKCLPGMTLDGVNEKGVVAEINVDGGPKDGWNEDGSLHILAVVRYTLDNFDNALDAALYVAENVKRPAGDMNFHFMIADAEETYIIENGVAHLLEGSGYAKVLTNFGVFSGGQTGGGTERYDLLAGGADIKSVWFTNAYQSDNVWHSDFESEAQHAAAVAQWAEQGTDKESHRGKTTAGGKAWWQSVHTTEYDFAAKTMKIAVQETDEWFTFAVETSGVTLDDEVTETSADGVKSSGIWTFAKGLLPSWLTPSREEPPTQASVAAKYTKPSDGIPLSDLKPTTFPPSVHASSHSTGSSDAIAPADIGAQEALPTTGTARVTYAVNISGNAATATSIAEGSISKLWNGKSFANKYFVDVDGHIYSANNTGGCYFQSPSGMKYYLSSTSSYDSGGERVYEYSFTSESNPSLVMKYSSSTKRITQQWGSYRYGTIDDFNPFLSESIAGIEFTGGGLTDYFSFTAASWQVSNSFVKTGAALYSGTTSYTANQWVVYDNKLWVSKQSTRGNAPYAGSAYWVDMSSLSALFSTANSANNLDNIRTSAADDTTAKNYIDGKLDKADVLKQSEVTDSTPYGKAADAKDLKEALAGVITEDDVKRVYNSNNTQYIDGNGDVYTAQFEEGGHWTLTQGQNVYRLDYKGIQTGMTGKPHKWATANGFQFVQYVPGDGRIVINGYAATTAAAPGLDPTNGDDIPGTFVYSNWSGVFTKQSSVFPETPSDSIVKESDVVAPTGGDEIDTSKAAQAEATRVALASKLDADDPIVENGMTVKGSVYSESLYARYDESSPATRYAPEHIENGDDVILLPSSSGTLALTDEIPDVSDKADSVAVAPAYDPSKTYAVDSPVTYGGRLYKCTTAITTAEAWNPAHWTEFAATDSDTAFVTDDNGHLVAKDTATGDDLYVDAYRMNSGTTIKDAAFNDLGTIADGASFALPAAIAGHMRDFGVILRIGATVPSFTFPLTNSDLEPWSEGVPEWSANTIYRITITETRSHKWEIHVASKGVA